MDNALAWIGKLADWVGQWFPRWVIVLPTHAAIKLEAFFLPRALRVWCGGFDGDMRVTTHGPGLFWYWPATSATDNYPTVFQTDDLPSQTMETLDGVSIAVGGMVSYRVSDVRKLLTLAHSPTKAVQALTLAAIHKVCCGMAWDTLKDEQRRGTLNTKLRKEAQKALGDFGVDVDDCMLTDLARSRVYRLIQSTQQDNS